MAELRENSCGSPALCPKVGAVDPVVDVKMMPPIKLYGERRRSRSDAKRECH